MDPTGGYIDSPFVAGYYDHVLPYRERSDVPFYVDMARAAGGPVLEVGCGTGRILIPTARAGLSITGLDLAEPMLRVCEERLANETPEVRARVRLVRGDMRSFEVEGGAGAFALVTVPFRAFLHLLEVADQMACLAAIHRHLRPGGRLVLDIFNPSLRLLALAKEGDVAGEEAPFLAPGGETVIRRHVYQAKDPFRQVNEVDLIYEVRHPDGSEQKLTHRTALRYMFRFEAEHLLARCGFRVEALYSDYDRTPFGTKYPGELVFVAVRD